MRERGDKELIRWLVEKYGQGAGELADSCYVTESGPSDEDEGEDEYEAITHADFDRYYEQVAADFMALGAGDCDNTTYVTCANTPEMRAYHSPDPKAVEEAAQKIAKMDPGKDEGWINDTLDDLVREELFNPIDEFIFTTHRLRLVKALVTALRPTVMARVAVIKEEDARQGAKDAEEAKRLKEESASKVKRAKRR